MRKPAALARFHFIYQPEMRGLGDAVRLAQDFVGNEPFAVLLADTVIAGPSPLGKMVELVQKSGRSSVALEQCPQERVSRYGIAGGTAEDGYFALDRMEEKPAPEVAPCLRDASGNPLPYHAFAARYVFTPAIFEALAHCPPGLKGEIQLTDAMRTVMEKEGFRGAPRWASPRHWKPARFGGGLCGVERVVANVDPGVTRGRPLVRGVPTRTLSHEQTEMQKPLRKM